MGNVIDYLNEYGQYTFAERPFSEVDSLILCQLSYLKYDELVKDVKADTKAASLRNMRRKPQFSTLFTKGWYEKEYRALYDGVTRSRRFAGLRLRYYVNRIDDEEETQFSAVTFFLRCGIVYVAFRGTDETITGWKEDFNMVYMSPIPAQKSAKEYLEYVAGKMLGGTDVSPRPDETMDAAGAAPQFEGPCTAPVPGRFYIGGHSKGGNCAVYAALECTPEVRERIERIYCFDGPGFHDDIYHDENYKAIEDRIDKIVPESSLIGMLLFNNESYRVVRSRGIAVFQHDPFTWMIQNGQFRYKEEIHKRTVLQNKVVNQWVESMNAEERERFVETMFAIIRSTKVTNVVDLYQKWKENAAVMINTAQNLDGDTKQFMKQSMMRLFGQDRPLEKQIRTILRLH